MSKKEKKRKERYKSQEGFVPGTIYRGQEIHPFLVALPTGALVCGGHARWMMSPAEDPQKGDDLDIYCRDAKVFTEVMDFLKKDLKMKVRHKNEMAVSMKKLKPKDANSQATELRVPWLPRIQVIKPLVKGAIVAKGSVEAILAAFDFTCVRAAVWAEEETLALTGLVDADFEHDEAKKYLRIKNIHCPISSTLRCIKYGRKGYWSRPHEIIKLMLDWEARDDEYRSSLADFLIRIEDGEELTKEQIEQFETMLRID